MQKIIRNLFLLLVTLLLSPLAQAQVQQAKTQARLLSDYDPSTPDKEFRVGVEFKIEPDWHIYWQYPGEFGLPTRVTFKLPEGFKVGDLQWPVPEKFMQSGDQVGYGYSSEVVLFATVKPGLQKSLEAKDIQAEVKWLNCSPKLCVPDSANLELKDLAAQQSNFEELNFWQKKVPVPVLAAESALKVTQSIKGGQGESHVSLVLEWSKEPGQVEFFPALHKDIKLEDVFISQEGLQSLISFKAKILSGVLSMPSKGFTALIKPTADNQHLGVFSFDINLDKGE
jgi:DsbC/DsbD-like thiol-disulfide interchange protein